MGFRERDCHGTWRESWLIACRETGWKPCEVPRKRLSHDGAPEVKRDDGRGENPIKELWRILSPSLLVSVSWISLIFGGQRNGNRRGEKLKSGRLRSLGKKIKRRAWAGGKVWLGGRGRFWLHSTLEASLGYVAIWNFASKKLKTKD